MAKLQPSPQQQAFFDWIANDRGSLQLIARAGTGKTTALTGIRDPETGETLLDGAVHHMLREADGRRISVFLGAFNRDISKELGARVTGLPGIKAGTMHGAGFGACRKWSPALERKDAVDEHKCRDIFDRLLLQQQMHDYEQTFCLKLASLAKQEGVGILADGRDPQFWAALVDRHDLEYDLLGPDAGGIDGEEAAEMLDHAIESTKKVLRESIKQNRERIDYDDMLYVPVFHNLRMWQNDWMLMDEDQDANRIRVALARKMLRPGGRFVGVGDDRQAIYGFTGADSDSIANIIKAFNCKTLPLSVTYRCPKLVVALANTWVPDLEAHESAPEGEVRRISAEDFIKLAEGRQPLPHEHDWARDVPPGAGDAVLCRNVKPLIELAYRLIRAGRPVQVEGRDIGAGLLSLARRWKVNRLEALQDRLAKFKTREVEKWRARGKEQKAAAIEDKVETLLVLIAGLLQDGKQTVADLTALIESVFSDDARKNCLLLSTVHKSKGKEWDRVFVLDRLNLMPSRWARQDWQVQAEYNLLYVAVTRAKRVFVDIVMTPPKAEQPKTEAQEPEAVK